MMKRADNNFQQIDNLIFDMTISENAFDFVDLFKILNLHLLFRHYPNML